MKKLILLLSIFGSSVVFAQNATHIGAYGGMSYTGVQGQERNSSASASQSSGAFGISFETPLTDYNGLELGFVGYSNRLEVPLILRFGGAKSIVTGGLGVYAKSVNSQAVTTGALLALGLNFPVSDNASIVLEARYLRDFQYGVFANNNDGNSDILALAGFKMAL